MAEEGQMNYKMLALFVILVIIITGVASFTFFTYFSVSGDEENTEEVQSIEDIRPTYQVGDFTVNISLNVADAPLASSAQTSISPKR
jgi:flagellar FliL protein